MCLIRGRVCFLNLGGMVDACSNLCKGNFNPLSLSIIQKLCAVYEYVIHHKDHEEVPQLTLNTVADAFLNLAISVITPQAAWNRKF